MLIVECMRQVRTRRAAARRHKCFVLGLRQRRGRVPRARSVRELEQSEAFVTCSRFLIKYGTVPRCTSGRSLLGTVPVLGTVLGTVLVLLGTVLGTVLVLVVGLSLLVPYCTRTGSDLLVLGRGVIRRV